MNINDRVFQMIEQNAQIRRDGGYIAIPWLTLPKLSTVIPGVQQGRYYLVTANSKVGKTQLTDFLFLYEPLLWHKNNPQANLKPKIFYFSLEMSKEDKLLQALSHYTHLRTKKIYTPDQLLSLFHDKHLSSADIELLRTIKPELDFLEEHVTFIDRTRNPFGIYKTMREYAESHGHYVYKTMPWKNEKTGETEVKRVIDYYVPDDPDEVVIVIIDHISLFTPERGMTLHESISKFSSDYAIAMRDHWRYCPVIVQQQSAASEAQQFTQSGQQIINKLKPTTDGLGDNKLTQRDIDIMFGLFAPQRYNIGDYHDYDINRMGDHYREFLIILNRRGGGNLSDDLFFNGAVNMFRELPKPSDPAIQSVYDYIKTLKTY